MTGLPGWMRFGFSPGWLGHNSYGLGPGAHYLTHGTWPTPQMNDYWQRSQVPPGTQNPAAPGFPQPYDPYGATQINPDQELNILKEQSELLEDELETIKKRIQELEKTDV
jgi:hypothetical protein